MSDETVNWLRKEARDWENQSHPHTAAQLSTAADRIEALKRERDECRAKNTELNRRATRAEGAIREKAATSGPSLGRALANAGYSAEKARADDLEREVERLKGRLGQMCSYPFCDCGGGAACQVIDGTPPEMCERSLLIEAEAQAARLREALERYANSVERLAFEMKPPNQFTPRFVELAIGMRQALADSAPDPKAQAVAEAGRHIIATAIKWRTLPSLFDGKLAGAVDDLAALREEEE